MNVEEVFFSIARDIKQRLSETDTKTEVNPQNQKGILVILVSNYLFSLTRLFCSLKPLRLTNKTRQEELLNRLRNHHAVANNYQPIDSSWYSHFQFTKSPFNFFFPHDQKFDSYIILSFFFFLPFLIIIFFAFGQLSLSCIDVISYLG